MGGGEGGERDGSGKGDAGDVYWVDWKTPEERAHDLEAWVDETAQKGVVFTLYELTEGEDTRGTGTFWPGGVSSYFLFLFFLFPGLLTYLPWSAFPSMPRRAMMGQSEY